jgi:hypothetical protein
MGKARPVSAVHLIWQSHSDQVAVINFTLAASTLKLRKATLASTTSSTSTTSTTPLASFTAAQHLHVTAGVTTLLAIYGQQEGTPEVRRRCLMHLRTTVLFKSLRYLGRERGFYVSDGHHYGITLASDQWLHSTSTYNCSVIQC